MTCEIKPHFTCDGSGRQCNACGESESACSCGEEQDLGDCEECEGTGKICVEHESPCGDGVTCDAAKKALPPVPVPKKTARSSPKKRKAK